MGGLSGIAEGYRSRCGEPGHCRSHPLPPAPLGGAQQSCRLGAGLSCSKHGLNRPGIWEETMKHRLHTRRAVVGGLGGLTVAHATGVLGQSLPAPDPTGGDQRDRRRGPASADPSRHRSVPGGEPPPRVAHQLSARSLPRAARQAEGAAGCRARRHRPRPHRSRRHVGRRAAGALDRGVVQVPERASQAGGRLLRPGLDDAEELRPRPGRRRGVLAVGSALRVSPGQGRGPFRRRPPSCSPT